MKRVIILGCLVFCIGLTEDKCEGPPKWQHSRAEGSVFTNEVLGVKEGLSTVKVEGDHGLWANDIGMKNPSFMIPEDDREMKSVEKWIYTLFFPRRPYQTSC